ncbi:MAG: GNAT family N-acetyltransferase [Vogesella sp.]|nr:GNAT family N-acetyltransferase [Vogesella sp.]
MLTGPNLAGYVLGRFTVHAKQALLADPQYEVWLAERDGQLLAYATLHHGQACPGQHAANCELATLYVHPLFAGQGWAASCCNTLTAVPARCG